MIEAKGIYVIDKSYPYEDYIPIDLSTENPQLADIRLDDPRDFGSFIDRFLQENNARAAYGGYNETRNLYRPSTIFNDQNIKERNIHIGIDIWVPDGTAVLAAHDGVVHSFANNEGKGNYGPTIILIHSAPDGNFHTLYGHLSLEGLSRFKIGDTVAQGQKIAELGDDSVNGGYPPRLHFQIIKDLEDNFGDYPGVCSRDQAEFHLQNCPDPNSILNIKP